MINFASLQGLIRHLLTFGGGFVFTSDDELQMAVGAAMTLIGLGWSMLEKRPKS